MDSEKDKNNDGIVVQIGAINLNGLMMFVMIRVKDEIYKFDKKGNIITYKGSLNSKKRGAYEVDFTITCEGR